MSTNYLRPDEIPRAYYSDRVGDRLVAELLGVCKGIVADGVVNEAEVIALGVWIKHHPDVVAGFPGREICGRFHRIMEGGIIDDDERLELQGMLTDLVGEPEDRSGNMKNSTRLPLDDPEPTVFFEGKEFVFTGHFCMPRRACEQAVTDRAGVPWKTVRRSTDYLVVGTVASDAWVQASWGNKILSAMDLKAQGEKIAIVSEAHWLASMEEGA